LLFNPFISFNYQFNSQEIVTLNEHIEYKPQLLKSIVLSNISAYYAPEEFVQQRVNAKGTIDVHVLVNCQADVASNRPFIEVFRNIIQSCTLHLLLWLRLK